MEKTKEQLIQELNNVNINLKLCDQPNKIQKLGVGTNYIEIKCQNKEERDMYQSLLDSFQESKLDLKTKSLKQKKITLEGELMCKLNKEYI